MLGTGEAAIAGFAMMGLLGGFTHCAAMCGPFVIAQTEAPGTDTAQETGILRKLRSSALIPYHLGRASTYVMLAVLFSSLLNLAFLFLPVKNIIVVPMLLLAGVIFLVAAFPALAEIFPWAARMQLLVPFKRMSHAIGVMMRGRSVIRRYALGVLLGFMPCGMVLAALMAAASLPTPVQSGMAMAAFAAGTFPALFAVAAGGQTIKTLYPETFTRVRQAMLGFSALWLFVMAGLSIL